MNYDIELAKMKQRLRKMIRENPYWGGIVFDKAQQALKGATPTVEQLDEAERQLIKHMTTKKKKPIMVNKVESSSSPKEFTKLPNDILFAQTLSPSTKTLYALLVSYARDKSYCYPSQISLGADLGVSTKSIGRWLKELTSHGLITTKRRGLAQSNVYYLAKSERKEG